MVKHACKPTSFLLALITCCCGVALSEGNSPRFVCYFPNVGYYRAGDGRYLVDNVDPSLCTHLIYSFAKLDGTTYTIQPSDTAVDIDSKFYEKFVYLKSQNPRLFTMIAIGGYSDSNESDKYSRLVKSSTNIKNFVGSVTQFLYDYKFDGLDFAWEYPAASDKAGFANLLRSLQNAFTPNGYYLSVAVPSKPKMINDGYDVVTMNSTVDFVNLKTFDMHGAWNPGEADHHAPLYGRPWDDVNSTECVDCSVDYLIERGMAPDKINLGIPVYGRSWTLATLASVDSEPPAEADGPGNGGDFTGQPGFLGYHEICYAVKEDGWEVIKDPDHLNGPYAVSPYAPKTWVGFDDAEMAAVKANYAIDNHLGGSMVWDISTDDFANLCGDGNNPVMKSVSQTMGIGSLSPRGRFVCYHPNWTGYRTGGGQFTVDDIDPNLCTDYVYAFAILDGKTFQMKPFDTKVDIDDGAYTKFVQMKAKNPNIRTWIAIGGWDDSHESDKYSQLVSSQENISKFVQSAYGFLKTYGFDGLDIDWEFPMSESDKKGLADMLYYMRGVFNAFGYSISVAMSINTTIIDLGYDINALKENVDFVNLMAYDMHGPWEPLADHHAPLYKRPWEEEDYDNYIDYTVKHLISHGLPPEKLNLGIPLYGQSWSLQTIEIDADPTPPARATSPGTAGSLTNQAGFLGYNEICNYLKSDNWQAVSDPEMLNGPYAFSLLPPYTWVGYDDPEMAAHKARYVRDKKLGGAMVWDMSTDDFRASCSSQANPILKAIARTLSDTATTASTQPPELSTSTTLTFTTESRTPSTKLSTMTRYTTQPTEPATQVVTTSATTPKEPNSSLNFKPNNLLFFFSLILIVIIAF